MIRFVQILLIIAGCLTLYIGIPMLEYYPNFLSYAWVIGLFPTFGGAIALQFASQEQNDG